MRSPARRPRLALAALEDRTTPAVFPVTTTADNGNNATPTAGSLREAVLLSNKTAGLDDITFAVPGGGVQVFTLPANLPTLTDPVLILGYSQPGSAPNTLADGDNATILVQLDGAGTFNALDAFANDMTGTVIEGLSVVNMATFGLRLIGTASRDVVVRGNFF